MQRFNSNPFYVQPGGDLTQGLAGLGDVLQQNRAMKEQKAAEEARQQRIAQAQQAARQAIQSGDPMMVADVAIQYPEVAEIMNKQAGIVDEQKQEDATNFYTALLTAPADKRAQIYQQRIDMLSKQGRDPSNTMQSYRDYLADPEMEARQVEAMFAGTNPTAYKAYREATQVKPPETRELKQGDRIVTQQFNERSGKWENVADAARFNPKSGVNVSVSTGNNAPELGKLSTDYGYVLDPETGKPVINPETGLPMAAPVPGSKASLEISQAQDKKSMQGDLADITSDTVIESAVNARNLIGRSTTGAGGTLMSNIPWSDASDLFRYTDSLKATAAAENINKMRQASPTGGALGNASDADIKLLKDKAGALDPRSERYPEQLDDYVKTLLRIVNGKEAGDALYSEQWLGRGAENQSRQVDSLVNKYLGEGK